MHIQQFNFLFSMYSIIFILFIVSNIIAEFSIEQSCLYCQTTVCHCSSTPLILNCSSYLLDLSFVSNCSEIIPWKIVDFSSRNIEYFDSTKLLSLRMEHLLLKSNLITYIHDQTFDSLGDILVELDLEINQISNISSKWLNSNLIQLKILNLASNQLEAFSNLDNVRLPNLQELNLSRNLINHFPQHIHQWTSLTTLDLSFNKLSNIPRYALMGLNNLTWLSLASNRNLTCIIQDSFKYLKSLKYLDLSSTNLIELDACIFIQLTGLKTLQFERISLNCTSCWLLIARKNSLHISGECLTNRTIQHLDSLTNQQLEYACSKSSIDCSKDYCEPGLIIHQQISDPLFSLAKTSPIIKTRTIISILGMIIFVVLITLIISIVRWRKNKTIFCCQFSPTTSTAEATRRRREHHKQIIDSNPVVIESVVTHGANMNVPSYPHQNYAYVNDETSKNKRKLFNPMFADSPTSDIRQQQLPPPPLSANVSNDSSCQNNYLYSEHL